MAQQALSVAIKQLESELGYDLFERVAGRIRLTGAGAAFAEEARVVLAGTQRAVERGRRAAQGEVGVLRVAYCSAAMADVLPQAIATSRERYPDLVLELRRQDKPDQLAALASGDLDLAITYHPFESIGRGTQNLWNERVLAAVHGKDALANAGTIDPAQLAGRPIVRFAGEALDVLRMTADEMFATAAVAPRYVADIADIETALGFVAAGIGIALFNEQIARTQRPPGIVFVPVSSGVRFRLAAIWNAGVPIEPAVRRFVDLIVANTAAGPPTSDIMVAATP